MDETGAPVEDLLSGELLCGEGALYGCTDQEGHEVIPFIHSSPVEFTSSGFALVREGRRPTQRPCGYFYVDARYERKLEAMTIEGIPEAWIPLDVVRYRDNGKIGFLDLREGIVTPPLFDSAFSFYETDGKTLVCEGCHPQRWEQCAPPEAHCTGAAFLIDEDGKRLKEEPDRMYVEYWWCKANPGKQFEPAPDAFCK